MRQGTFLIPILVTIGLATAAQAQIANGDFAAGLSGWTPSGTGPSVSWHPGVGNPAGSAYFHAGSGGGDASLSQGFLCGSGRDGGNCAITLDYRYYRSGGTEIQVVVYLDGVPAYSANHSTEDPSWHTIPLVVPCGDHLLTFTVNTVTMGFFGNWDVFLDNVAAECTLPVGVESRDWGTLKAQYSR